MSKIIEKTEFLTVTEKTVRVVELNLLAVMDAVNKYLESNIIAECKYRCTGVKNSGPTDVIHVELQRIEPEYAIDENFDSDANWDAFCEDMAKKLRVRVFDVPYWYHPK